jgi:uncharacterized protein YndB with AHSA1/START domain
MSEEPRHREEAGERRSIAFEYELPEPVEKVWRALTTPEIVSEWLMPTGLRAEPGERFSLEEPGAEPIECEVISIEHERSIRLGWRDADARRQNLDSTVLFEVARTQAGGTRLRIVHEVRHAARTAAVTACLGGAANDNLVQLRLAA